MAQLYLKIEGIKIITDNNYTFLTQNSNNYDSIKFEFDEEWNGFSKTAVLHQKKQEITELKIENDMCYIPERALKYGLPLYVSVHGSSSDGLTDIDTEHMSFNVKLSII